MKYYVGLDVHKDTISGNIQNEEGQIIKEDKVGHSIENIKTFVDWLPKEQTKIVLESSGLIYDIYDYLVEQKFSVIVAHPKMVKVIAYAKIKTDKIDAKRLADLLRANLIPESYIPSKEIRELRTVLRYRISLSEERTRSKNRVYGVLLKLGMKYKKGSIFSKKARTQIMEKISDNFYKLQVENDYNNIDNLKKRIKEIDERLDIVSTKYNEIKIIRTLKGIGIFSALMIIAELGDYKRFENGKQASCFSGLSPSTRESAGKVVHGKIMKNGSKYLRWSLIQCANISIRYSDKLRKYYSKIKNKKGHNKAIVAVAHKMLVIVFQMLKTNTPYLEK